MKKFALIFASVVTAEAPTANMIFLKNETTRPLYFKVQCDRKLLEQSVTEFKAAIAAEGEGAKGSAEFEVKQDEKYKYMFVEQGFNTLPVDQTTKQSVASYCETIFISAFTEKENGDSLKFMETQGISKGEQVTFTEQENSIIPTWTQDSKVCGGDQCGCRNGFCWMNCVFGWCHTTKTFDQSYIHVKCKQDIDCRNEWNCGSGCTIFPKFITS